MAFKRIKDPKNEDRGYLPLGTIQVTWIGFNSTTKEKWYGNTYY